MITLRLTQIVPMPDMYQIEFALEGDGPRLTARANFSYALSRTAQEKIRWYIESYAKMAYTPETALALAVERQITTIGIVFFRTIFYANDAT